MPTFFANTSTFATFIVNLKIHYKIKVIPQLVQKYFHDFKINSLNF